MGRLEPELDPWEDTEAHRAPERDDPFDDGSTDGPFGTLGETMGVPRRTPGTRSSTPFAGSRLLMTGITVLLVLITVAAVVATLLTILF